MKKKSILLVLILLSLSIKAQDTDQNFTKVTTYKTASTTSIATPSIQQANVEVVYYDGLGRPIEQIAHKQSGTGKDIRTHIEYNQYGQQLKDYLSYVNQSPNLSINPNGQVDVLSFYSSSYNVNTSVPFSEKQVEASPLSRVFKQAAPGESWTMNSGNEIKFEYKSNVQDDQVKNFTATTTWNSSLELYDIALSQGSNYSKNQLYKTITKDENWKPSDYNNNTTQEFKNKLGQVILKRTFNASDKLDTYYVYDQFGNLTYVIPPLAAANPSGQLNELCYQYKYDSRNRLVAKKLPSKQWEFIVYNNVNLPVATGPVFSPFEGVTRVGWMITKYDVLSRPISTGWYDGIAPTDSGRKSYQTIMNAISSWYEAKNINSSILPIDDIPSSYTDKVYPNCNLNPYKLLTTNYYDDYDFPNGNMIDYNVQNTTIEFNLKGLPTASWTRVLQTEGDTNAEISYTLYDSKYRPVRNFTLNYLGGFTKVDTVLDWFGKVLRTTTTHQRTNADSPIIITENFEYTPQDRLYKHKHEIDGEPEQTLTENFYDELGQLITKTTGGNLQDVDYKYNIRGWLTSINEEETALSEDGYVQLGAGDLFAFKISYDNLLINNISGVKELYNGNISETQWVTSTDNVLRHYSYQYDNLNRLLNATFRKPIVGDEDDAFNESLSYDKNGNITDLNRNGKIFSDVMPIDNLTYLYNGNQLKSVTDSSDSPQGFNDGNPTGEDYLYDANGNMYKDKNKDIQNISYNHLNLPTEIQFGNGNNIKYIYNAIGQKVKKSVKTGNEYADTDYLSGFQYRGSYTSAQGDQSEAKLQYFPHAEGYIQHVDGRYFYIYHYTDHLGNIRLSYTYDEDAGGLIKIMEENHYYPFGLKHDNYNTQHLGYSTYTDEDEITSYVLEEVPKFVGDGSYNYKYNGKELQDELGLNVYDYDNRVYDPAIGRFYQTDPKGELGRRWSPYNYCFNNPIYFQDPDGMWPWPNWTAVKAVAKATYNKVSNSLSDSYNKAKKSSYNPKTSNTDIAKLTVDFSSNVVKSINTNQGTKKSSSLNVDLKVKNKDNVNDGAGKDKGDRNVRQVEFDDIMELTNPFGPGGSKEQTALVPTGTSEVSSSSNSSTSSMETNTTTPDTETTETVRYRKTTGTSTKYQLQNVPDSELKDTIVPSSKANEIHKKLWNKFQKDYEAQSKKDN